MMEPTIELTTDTPMSERYENLILAIFIVIFFCALSGIIFGIQFDNKIVWGVSTAVLGVTCLGMVWNNAGRV